MWTTLMIILSIILVSMACAGIVIIIKGKSKFKRITGAFLVFIAVFSAFFSSFGIDIRYDINKDTAAQAVAVIEEKTNKQGSMIFSDEPSTSYDFVCGKLSGSLTYFNVPSREYLKEDFNKTLQYDSQHLTEISEDLKCIVKYGEVYRYEWFKLPQFFSATVWIYTDDAIIQILIDNTFFGDKIDLLEIANAIE